MSTLQPDHLFAERYLLQALIGQGGLGQVWLAEDTLQDNRAVAIKLAQPEYRDRAQFIAEAELMQRFDHPHIIKILQIGRDEPLGEYYVMEYFPDGSLLDFMADPACEFALPVPDNPNLRYVPLKTIIQILRPIAQALDYVHREHPGVLHRDLKLSNILVNQKRGRYVLTDFSLQVGAPAIMSPEQLLAWRSPPDKQPPLDWRSDLFSFGACLYKLTTGTYPFSIQISPEPMQAVEEMYHYHLVEKRPVDRPRERNPANRDLHNERVNQLIWQLTSKSRTARTLDGQLTKVEDALDLLAKAAKRNLAPCLVLAALLVAAGLVAAGLFFGIGGATTAGPNPGGEASPAGGQAAAAVTQELSVYPTATPTSPPPTATPAPTEEPTAPPTVETEPTEEPATTEPEEPPTPEPTVPECIAGVELRSPLLDQTVSEPVTFEGVVDAEELDYYKIEFQPPGSDTWSCCLVEPTYQPVPEAAPLGVWDIFDPRFIPGQYGIRLMAVKLDGNFEACESRLILEK